MENDKANVKVAALTAELQALRVELAAYKMQSDVMPSSDGDESTPLIDEDALQQLVKGMSTVGDDKVQSRHPTDHWAAACPARAAQRSTVSFSGHPLEAMLYCYLMRRRFSR